MPPPPPPPPLSLWHAKWPTIIHTQKEQGIELKPKKEHQQKKEKSMSWLWKKRKHEAKGKVSEKNYKVKDKRGNFSKYTAAAAASSSMKWKVFFAPSKKIKNLHQISLEEWRR